MHVLDERERMRVKTPLAVVLDRAAVFVYGSAIHDLAPSAPRSSLFRVASCVPVSPPRIYLALVAASCAEGPRHARRPTSLSRVTETRAIGDNRKVGGASPLPRSSRLWDRESDRNCTTLRATRTGPGPAPRRWLRLGPDSFKLLVPPPASELPIFARDHQAT